MTFSVNFQISVKNDYLLRISIFLNLTIYITENGDS